MKPPLKSNSQIHYYVPLLYVASKGEILVNAHCQHIRDAWGEGLNLAKVAAPRRTRLMH